MSHSGLDGCNCGDQETLLFSENAFCWLHCPRHLEDKCLNSLIQAPVRFCNFCQKYSSLSNNCLSWSLYHSKMFTKIVCAICNDWWIQMLISTYELVNWVAESLWTLNLLQGWLTLSCSASKPQLLEAEMWTLTMLGAVLIRWAWPDSCFIWKGCFFLRDTILFLGTGYKR